LTERSIAVEDKRRLLLDAAVRVFAKRGYHGSRVGDIAEEAGFRAVEASDEPAPEKLEGIAKILLRTWRNDPALVTVMVREVARSPQLQGQVAEVREAFGVLQRVIEQGQREGAFRRDVDPSFAAWIVYGGLEEVLTGWVLGGLPDGEDDVTTAERTATGLALRGLAV
jgi:AcrR family transcriptional regulator